MLQWLISIAAYIVAIGLLVAVHEYGHFWVARRMGVRVLRYSIGFGPKLLGRTSKRTGTDYWLSAIPLGGYVKMLDEREGPVAEADRPYAFNRVHPLRRIAIVAAGPGVNIVFAIVAYWLIFMLGVPGIKPIIGPVDAGSLAAKAGLQANDRIVAMGANPIDDWQELHLGLIERALDNRPVQLTVDHAGRPQRRVSLDLAHVSADPKKLFQQLGLQMVQPAATPQLGRILADSPAAAAGLKAGDKIVSLDGKTMDSPQALVDAIRSRPDQDAKLRVRRNGETRSITIALTHAKANDGHTIGRLGATIGVDAKAWSELRTLRRLGPLAAIPAAVKKTWEFSTLTVRLMGRMIVGQVSWHNVSGPIQIASLAGQTAQIGLVPFLSFLALISVSLAVLNLLPIPVLDGGHLLYYAVEWIRGRPLSEAVQAAGQQLGMVALLMLMTVAFYNDILRLLG